MKKSAISPWFLALLLGMFLFIGSPFSALETRAEELGYPQAPGAFSREELAQMLAPIALYPDALLSQVLMAATYPIEVIEADRWRSRNPGLTDAALDGVLVEQDWDPSVKALCHFPSVLALMSERIGATTDLGNAFLAQEAEVMDVVQELRARAFAQGGLATNAQQRVIVESETIIIRPADPRVVFVPYYDPFVIYGPWWYPAYPPYFWGPPATTIGFGIFFRPGTYLGYSFGSWSYFDWHRHTIFIDVQQRPRFVRHDRWITRPGRWVHAPTHRHGVAYRDQSTARRYGQPIHNSGGFRRDQAVPPGRVDPGRSRSWAGNHRARTDQPPAQNAGSLRDGQRQDRQRVDRNRQVRDPIEPERQPATRFESNRPNRTLTDGEKRVEQESRPARQEVVTADPGRRGWQRSGPDRKPEVPADRGRQVRQPVQKLAQGQGSVDPGGKKRRAEDIQQSVKGRGGDPAPEGEPSSRQVRSDDSGGRDGAENNGRRGRGEGEGKSR